MHWIQTIRERLELSRAELAHYLGLSVHMIISIENDRRHLPLSSLRPAITLFNVIRDGRTRGLAPPSKEDIRCNYDKTRLRRQCGRRLDRCKHKLKKMQNAYDSACRRLGAYHSLALALAPLHHNDDHARLRWTQRKIIEAMYQVQNNNLTAQHLLAAEIAGIKSMMLTLEEDPNIGSADGASASQASPLC